LRKFQIQAPIRPLLDEIVESTEAPGIVLRHFDDDILKASAKRNSSRPEIKEVSKVVLEVLRVHHADAVGLLRMMLMMNEEVGDDDEDGVEG